MQHSLRVNGFLIVVCDCRFEDVGIVNRNRNGNARWNDTTALAPLKLERARQEISEIFASRLVTPNCSRRGDRVELSRRIGELSESNYFSRNSAGLS